MKKTNEIALEESHLILIEDSLYFTQLKDIKNPLIADKKKLIFKIVDRFKVTESIAKKYINILESRNLIEISKDAVYYNQKKFNERKNKELNIDKYFENQVK